MSTFVTLDSKTHKDLKIDPTKVEAQGAQERMIPVVMSEFLKLIVQYPIVLTKNIETGRFLAVVLLGFDEQENLFWNNNIWEGIYTPLNVMRQPFFIGEDQGQGIICIDSESNCLSDNTGEAIFPKSGAESPYLQKIKAMLAELIQGDVQTAAFIQTLLDLKLIMPMSLDITFANLSEKQVKGLYTIDEDKLAELSADNIMNLHQKNYLKPIYTMIASLSHIYALINKKNTRNVHEQR
jgi:hypothetical protein